MTVLNNLYDRIIILCTIGAYTTGSSTRFTRTSFDVHSIDECQ